ncbi:hypothetical protein ACTA71_005380 [Dictyostelium dimigraforme]
MYNYLILFILYFIVYSNSQQQQILNQKEYGCMENLLTNLGTISKVYGSPLGYDFCNTHNDYQPSVNIICDQDSINSLSLGQSNMTYVIGDDFSCFENLNFLLLNSTVYNTTIYSSLPQNIQYFQIYGYNLIFSNLESSSVSYFTIKLVNQTIETQINFSYFKNVLQLIMEIPSWIRFQIGSHLIYFNNDLDGSRIWESDIKIISMNMPSLKYIKGSLDITLPIGFLESSWSNLSTIENITDLKIHSNYYIQFPSVEFSNIKSDNLKLIWFDSYIIKVPSIINLSTIGNSLETISFSKCSRNFQYGGGLLPFILPNNKNFKSFSFIDGYIQTFNLLEFNNVEVLSLANNDMSGSLPSIFNKTIFEKLIYLDISDNKITGTIDDSFCAIDITLRNNLMNGTIPSCFTCFFGLQAIQSRFFGNNFTNYYQSSRSIIVPNFIQGKTKNYSSYLEYEFFIFGENLGGNWIPNTFIVDDNPESYYSSKVLIINKLIRVISYLKPPDVISLVYGGDYVFKLSTGNIKPHLNYVNWPSTTSNLIFDGSFFTFNISIINISIGNENCLVTATTFNQITCTLSNVLDPFQQDILSFITIGNLTTQFTLNPGLNNTILNCSNNYNDCNGNGYCLSDIGQCKCNSNYQGVDCSIPYIECNPIDCSGNGFCKNTTGECQCDSNYQGTACSLPFVECIPNDCNGNGICKNTTGKCQCDSNYQGSDCSLPFIQCNTIDCNGNGVCTNSTGICQCNSNYQGDACQLPFKDCLSQCNNNLGKCNNQTGICICPINPHGWSGVDCSIPLHTISGAAPSNTNGGIASIYGWFGNIHTGKQVFIGNQECTPIYNITETEIICNSPAGTGLKSISVIQNSINVTSKDIYQYYSNDKQCPNHCTSTLNGICNSTTGYCNCIGRWSGYDCSLYSNPSTGGGSIGGGNDNNVLPVSNTTIDGNTGGTSINNQQTNYQILISKLIEIDFNGNQINEYPLLNKWSIFSNISKTVYTFIQSIQNDQCNITYTIEEINNDRDISFAGVSFKFTSGSVKMTVSIENYQYSSNLNTLQLQMKSSVSEIQTNDKNDCNNDQIEINSTPNQDNTLNYIAIKKDAKVLNGRFLDRIESDGKSTFMQTILISKSNDSIIVGMNLPHCTKKCLLDPDFSVLVSPEFIDECSNDNKLQSWFLTIVITLPIIGCSIIIALLYIFYKKRFIEAPFKRKIELLNRK